MAHLRETFPIIEDLATGEGFVLHRALDGEAVASKQGLKAFAFKTHDGNFVLPTLTPEGKVPVDFSGAGVPLRASSDGEVAGALTLTTVCEIDLDTDKTYGKIIAKGSCFKEAIFYLIQQDDVAEEIIASGIVGPGQYDMHISLGDSGQIVAGASGTQKLILKAKNLNKLSDFMGHVTCLEFVAGV